MDKTQRFYVLKDDGKFYPMAFITVADAAGEMRRKNYEKKMDEGETIVTVTMTEV